MRKTILPILIPFIAVMTLLGCTNRPEKTAREAMESWRASNYERLYGLASSRLKSDLPRDFFVSQANKRDYAIMLSYKMTKTEGDDDTARFDVAITIPDFSKMDTETSAALLNGTIPTKQIQEILQKGATIEKLLIMKLSRESDGWRVERFKPFDNALDRYRKVRASQSYKDAVKLVTLHATRVDPRLGEDLVLVEGKIANNGKELLSKVELTVRFMDDQGKVIHEAKVYPILVTGCTSADVIKHMQNSGEFSSHIRIPLQWTGKVEGDITDIELGDEHMGCGGHSHTAVQDSGG